MKKKNVKIEKILNILSKDGKFGQLANVLDKISVKESEQIREVIPVRQWVNDPYYIGKDGCEKLYPFWKDLICDIFLV